MATPSAFIIPIRGLGQGSRTYQLKMDDAFFSSFPEASIAGGDLDLRVDIDRRSRELIVDFNVEGTVKTDCDRCLAGIQLPVRDERRLIIKLTEQAEELIDEGDIVYLHPDTSEFNLAPFAYEQAVLALPMIRVYNCREGEPPYPCDEDTLRRIESVEEHGTSDPAQKDPDAPSPWDVLKELNNNN